MILNSVYSQTIQTNEYLRQRLLPSYSDTMYLPLSDLLLAMKQLQTTNSITMLDYGCGGSPYQSLFPNADYRRADFPMVGQEKVNYILDTSGRIFEEAHTFDLILSTQVLEHVEDYQTYLSECYRLLKPGGILYCSTHGSYEDHGCPFDFQRWTAEGLGKDITRAGFQVIRVEKYTTGPRAYLFQLIYHRRFTSGLKLSVFTGGLWLFRKMVAWLAPYINRQCDRYLSNHRVVIDENNEHIFYIGIGVLAQKPLGADKI